jgi:hypothetical protein
MNCTLYYCWQHYSSLWETSCLCGRPHVFVGDLMSCLRCLCLFAHSGVQRMLCCVFVLFFYILCTLYCQFLWNVNFWFVFSNACICLCVAVSNVCCVVFLLCFSSSCFLCSQFSWNVHFFLLSLQYSLTFIFYIWTFIVWFHFQLQSSLSPTSHCQVTNTDNK